MSARTVLDTTDAPDPTNPVDIGEEGKEKIVTVDWAILEFSATEDFEETVMFVVNGNPPATEIALGSTGPKRLVFNYVSEKDVSSANWTWQLDKTAGFVAPADIPTKPGIQTIEELVWYGSTLWIRQNGTKPTVSSEAMSIKVRNLALQVGKLVISPSTDPTDLEQLKLTVSASQRHARVVFRTLANRLFFTEQLNAELKVIGRQLTVNVHEMEQ